MLDRGALAKAEASDFNLYQPRVSRAHAIAVTLAATRGKFAIL